MRKLLLIAGAHSLSILLGTAAYGHPIGPMGAEALAWQSEEIGQVVGGGSPVGTHSRALQVEGKSCVSGSSLNFNVRDDFAFDIDETVEVEIEFYTSPNTQKVTLTYDRNDGPPARSGFVDPEMIKIIELRSESANRWLTERISLERARFANLGFAGTDFTLRSEHEFIVCGISVKRSYTTPQPANFGTVVINVFDENEQRSPARMGIYDKTGRLPLPNEGAVPLRNFSGMSRIVALRHGATLWPVKNRSVFYVDGSYHASLPVGDYEVIVAKGPEYRISRTAFAVRAGKPRMIDIRLQRWTHMADKGWYSGDDHIHYTRDSAHDDHKLLLFVEAEGLNLGNTLQMGNSGNVYFRQYNWHQVSNARKTTSVLVPGQEDPRTSRHGHTIHLNIKDPVRDSTRYLLYHEAFSKTHAQGGITGYAQVMLISDGKAPPVALMVERAWR
jgi:hypothetical protein